MCTGRTDRRPCVISPYHYRLDWLMWFAAFQVISKSSTLSFHVMLFFCSIVYLFQNYAHNPWLVHLAYKMLNNDNVTMALIEENPFEGKDPPTYDSALQSLQQLLMFSLFLYCVSDSSRLTTIGTRTRRSAVSALRKGTGGTGRWWESTFLQSISARWKPSCKSRVGSGCTVHNRHTGRHKVRLLDVKDEQCAAGRLLKRRFKSQRKHGSTLVQKVTVSHTLWTPRQIFALRINFNATIETGASAFEKVGTAAPGSAPG